MARKSTKQERKQEQATAEEHVQPRDEASEYQRRACQVRQLRDGVEILIPWANRSVTFDDLGPDAADKLEEAFRLGEELGRIEVENLILFTIGEILEEPNPNAELVKLFSNPQGLDWFIDSDGRYWGSWRE